MSGFRESLNVTHYHKLWFMKHLGGLLLANNSDNVQ